MKSDTLTCPICRHPWAEHPTYESSTAGRETAHFHSESGQTQHGEPLPQCNICVHKTKQTFSDFKRDPYAFVWFNWTGLLCWVFGHREDEAMERAMTAISPLGVRRSVCLRCGADKLNGRWIPR